MKNIEIHEFSPAKLNLNLEVLGKRPDGYHNIKSLMIPLDYGDDVWVEIDRSSEGIECLCSHPDVPAGEGNLAWKAAKLFLDTAREKGHVKITIEKRIPIAGGLAGGSSNAASVLKALNKAYGALFDSDELRDIGLKIGSDIPFLLFGKPAVVEGRGERLTPWPVEDKWLYLVLNPGYGVSTAWAYSSLRLTTLEDDINIKHSQIGDVILVNHFEGPVFGRYPQLRRIKEELLTLGAVGALMSGSGPSIFGLFENYRQLEKAARRLAEKEQVKYFDARVAATTEEKIGGQL